MFVYIFFAIVGIPFAMAILSLFKPGLLESFIVEWPWEARRKRNASNSGHDPDSARR